MRRIRTGFSWKSDDEDVDPERAVLDRVDKVHMLISLNQEDRMQVHRA